ncbi:MAG: sulfotransferase [Verrucomicrobiaceae bacterium]
MRHRTRLADCLRQLAAGLVCPRFPRTDLERLGTALEILGTGGEAAQSDNEAPVFVLATSWRSGSTLLQRILCTDPSAFLWGEPFGRMALLPQITSALCAITREWPPKDFWIPADVAAASLATRWIANLYPLGEDFWMALRGFLLRWMGGPANRMGFRRWGMKEVRLGAAEARLLTWLFPKARIVVLVRHPFDAYCSLSRAIQPGVPWRMFSRWPDHPLTGAVSFARHWNALTTSWLNPLAGENAVVVRYEDLVAGRVDFRSLEAHLGLRLHEAQALGAKVGATPDRGELHAYERWLIAHEARAGMRALGYHASGTTDEVMPGRGMGILRESRLNNPAEGGNSGS